jgi:hypothetical protein
MTCYVDGFISCNPLMQRLCSVNTVIDNALDKRLMGSLDRRDVFVFLKHKFEGQGLGAHLREGLPIDSVLHDEQEERQRKLEARKIWLAKAALGSPTDDAEHNEALYAERHIRRGLFPSPYQLRYQHTDEEGNPVSVATKLNNAYYALQQKVSSGVTALGSSVGLPVHLASLEPDETAVSKEEATIRPFASKEPARVRRKSMDDMRDFLMQCAVEITAEKELPLNLSPFTAHRSTQLDQLYILFEMVKVHVVFVVTEEKALEGMISKDNLLQTLRKKVT